MDTKQAKEYIKLQMPSYLNGQGLNPNKLFRCLNPFHEDKNPSMSYHQAAQKVHCFSCQANYDVFDLIGIEYRLTDHKDIFKKAYELYGITPSGTDSFLYRSNKQPQFAQETKQEVSEQEFIAFFQEAQQNLAKTDYLSKRGISQEIACKYVIGYVENWVSPSALSKAREAGKRGPDSTPRVIIPTSKSSYTACDTRENIPDNCKQYSKMKEGKVNIFNPDALSGNAPCFVVEGEFDALSFLEIGHNAVALGGVANINLFLNIIRKQDVSCCLVIALDNDDAGKEATEKLVEELKSTKLRYRSVNLYDSYKDANEFLVKDRKAFESKVKEFLDELEDSISIDEQSKREERQIKKEQYLATSVANYVSAFKESIQQSRNKELIPTGFTQLDKELEGGLFEGLYIIGAISSLGKTTFVIQIADYIASNNQEVLYISLEMSRYEIMAKSISRHTLLLCMKTKMCPQIFPKTTRGITIGKRYDDYDEDHIKIIDTSIANYEAYAKGIFIIEGLGDFGVKHVRDAVKNHVDYTGNKPIVIIDYLQVLPPHDQKGTDKQNIDKAVLELKRISREYEIPVIAISSLNRQSYKDVISMEAFKESGGIEYSADVLMGLELKGAGEKDFNVDAAKKEDTRAINLKILKNRNGPTGASVSFNYYPKYNFFSENSCPDLTKNKHQKK